MAVDAFGEGRGPRYGVVDIIRIVGIPHEMNPTGIMESVNLVFNDLIRQGVGGQAEIGLQTDRRLGVFAKHQMIADIDIAVFSFPVYFALAHQELTIELQACAAVIADDVQRRGRRDDKGGAPRGNVHPLGDHKRFVFVKRNRPHVIHIKEAFFVCDGVAQSAQNSAGVDKDCSAPALVIYLIETRKIQT